MPTLISYFSEMDDPRKGNAPRHKFCDLMAISLLCALCGGETAVDMEDFGRMKEDFLRDFLELPHGIPCHDAYSRLFRVMKPTSFQTFFDKFRADFAAGAGDVPAIAIDGKEMRRSFDKAAEQSNMNIVTAFAHGARLTLGIAESPKKGTSDQSPERQTGPPTSKIPRLANGGAERRHDRNNHSRNVICAHGHPQLRLQNDSAHQDGLSLGQF